MTHIAGGSLTDLFANFDIIGLVLGKKLDKYPSWQVDPGKVNALMGMYVSSILRAFTTAVGCVIC